MQAIISYFFTAVAIYLVVGFFFTLFLYRKGLTQVDPGTKDAGFAFNLLIFPGMVVFWIFFLQKWLKTRNHETKS